MLRRSLLLTFLLLIHLQVFAGELINITGVKTLNPVVTTELTIQQVDELNRVGVSNANKYLSLHVIIDGNPAKTPVGCRFKLDGQVLSLTPMYPLGYDTYFEVQNRVKGNLVVTSRFKTPSHPLSKKTAQVVTAYPVAQTIPYNILFFNIRFSHAMADDETAYKYVKVYDENGVERKQAWRQKANWFDDGKVLALMIHPGRVKNGIHYESPLFDSSKSYTIKVSKDIKDVNGNPIATDYVQEYRVSGVDKISPALNKVQVSQPSSNTTNPVLLSFSEGIDMTSVIIGTIILDSENNKVPFYVRQGNADSEYQLYPDEKWKKGTYTLVMKSYVYDFAANRIERLFEVTDVKDFEKDKMEKRFELDIR